jgi:hypothetical protein
MTGKGTLAACMRSVEDQHGLDWMDFTQPPRPTFTPLHSTPDSRHSECTALTGPELACLSLCIFALIYVAELLVTAGTLS